MSSLRLSRLTDSGVAAFGSYLADLRANPTLAPPAQILEPGPYSEEVANGPVLEQQDFVTKRDAGRYLHDLISPLSLANLMRDVGLWSWLGLFYFDSICPAGANGRRKVRADAHYILNLDHRRIYRHLARTPYQIVDTIPEFNSLFLEQLVTTHGELIEQVVGGRLKIIRIPAAAETVERLYYDRQAGRPKPGIMSERRRGNLRSRFPVVVSQLEMTHDISGMSSDELISSLGPEFSGWLSTSPAGPGARETGDSLPGRRLVTDAMRAVSARIRGG